MLLKTLSQRYRAGDVLSSFSSCLVSSRLPRFPGTSSSGSTLPCSSPLLIPQRSFAHKPIKLNEMERKGGSRPPYEDLYPHVPKHLKNPKPAYEKYFDGPTEFEVQRKLYYIQLKKLTKAWSEKRIQESEMDKEEKERKKLQMETEKEERARLKHERSLRRQEKVKYFQEKMREAQVEIKKMKKVSREKLFEKHLNYKLRTLTALESDVSAWLTKDKIDDAIEKVLDDFYPKGSEYYVNRIL